MFLQIGGFILLSLFAVAVADGSIVAYRALNVIGLKGKLEATKVKVELENVEHGLRVQEHMHGQQVLALAEGESTKSADPKEEEPPEVVKGEIGLQPYPNKEWVEHQKLQRDAENAEFKPVYTGPFSDTSPFTTEEVPSL